jgi:hypothetical protein
MQIWCFFIKFMFAFFFLFKHSQSLWKTQPVFFIYIFNIPINQGSESSILAYVSQFMSYSLIFPSAFSCLLSATHEQSLHFHDVFSKRFWQNKRWQFRRYELWMVFNVFLSLNLLNGKAIWSKASQYKFASRFGFVNIDSVSETLQKFHFTTI